MEFTPPNFEWIGIKITPELDQRKETFYVRLEIFRDYHKRTPQNAANYRKLVEVKMASESVVVIGSGGDRTPVRLRLQNANDLILGDSLSLHGVARNFSNDNFQLVVPQMTFDGVPFNIPPIQYTYVSKWRVSGINC